MRNIIFFVLLSVFAGITGSLMTTAWIEPTFYNTQGSFLINRPVANVYISPEFPDPQISQRIQYGALSMYEKEFELGKSSFFPDRAFLGYAVLISSDGWAVAYMSEKNDIASRIVAMDYQGVSYGIEKVVVDPYTNFVYIKFNGNDFRVMSFVDENEMIFGDGIWSVHHGDIYKRFIGELHRSREISYNILKPYYEFDVVPVMNSIGIVVTAQGQFVGFVDEDDRLHNVWSVMHHMTSLLSEGILNNPTFSLNGYVVTYNGKLENNEDKPMYGFVVTNIVGTHGFLVGDIILQINKNNVVPETLYQTMYESDQETLFRVLRESREIDILITR